jgi:hypothetical protein
MTDSNKDGRITDGTINFLQDIEPPHEIASGLSAAREAI